LRKKQSKLYFFKMKIVKNSFYPKIGFFLSFFLAFVIILGFVYLLTPLFYIICWAGIIAFFVYPCYQKIYLKTKRKNLSSFIVLFFLVLFVIGPLSVVLLNLYQQILSILDWLKPFTHQSIYEFIEKTKKYPKLYVLFTKILDQIQPYLPQIQEKLTQLISSIVQAGFLSITNLAKFLFSIGFQSAFTILTLHYFLIDGEKVIKEILYLIPGQDLEKKKMLERVSLILKGVLYGNVLTALIQGILAFFIYSILGIPQNLFWAILTMLASFIPAFGTFLIWGPLVGYLFLTGSYIKGIILLVFCGVIISNLDNFLKPFLIGGKTKIHNLLIFFSVLGGIVQFGILGLFLGPLILALFLSIIEIYKHHLVNHLTDHSDVNQNE